MDVPDKPIDESAGQPASAGPAEVFPAPEPEKPPRKNLFQWWFNPESRFGRFNRRLLRSLVIIVVLFGLGVASLYFLRYQPLQRQYNENQAKLDAALENLNSLTSQAATLRASSANLQESNDSRLVETGLLRLQRDAAQARAELLAGKPESASAALVSAGKTLTPLAAAFKGADSSLAAAIQARLDLARTEITSDPKTAASDLVILAQQLDEMEALLFPPAP